MKMFSLLTAAALFSSIAATHAAELVTLTDTQLDNVVAGQASVSLAGSASASGLTAANTTITGSGTTAVSTGSFSASGTLAITSTSQ